MEKLINNFKLVSTRDKKYDFICFSLDASRPDSYIEPLEKEMVKEGKDCTILFDLKTSNGEGSRRFFEIMFRSNKLLWQNIIKVSNDDLSQEVKDVTNTFYSSKENQVLIENKMAEFSL